IAPSHEVGMTMAYISVGWSSVVNIFNVRSFNKSIFTIGFASNNLLFYGICFSLSFLFLTAIAPFGIIMHGNVPVNMFYCTEVSLNHWFIMVALSISPIIVVEIQKLLIRKGKLSF